MTHEKSCGAVVFTRSNGEIQYLLIRNLRGIYGFPKGHVEAGEREEQTALREIREETGIRVQLIPGFRREDEHRIPGKKDTMKKIVYFLGEYQDQEIVYQQEELTGALLADYEKAMGLFQYENSKRILREAHSFLTGR
ncbi:MAG: NUDIX domain-containing protein [Clostridia bacterium]|nr:NUDIX domain-containing protein [Clostridia bacterium]